MTIAERMARRARVETLLKRRLEKNKQGKEFLRITADEWKELQDEYRAQQIDASWGQP